METIARDRDGNIKRRNSTQGHYNIPKQSQTREIIVNKKLMGEKPPSVVRTMNTVRNIGAYPQVGVQRMSLLMMEVIEGAYCMDDTLLMVLDSRGDLGRTYPGEADMKDLEENQWYVF
uniref:Uncharacterized protein n=1 Tax=Cacopsylla melanoneura TaxID=428564 RepID=A0A8D8TUW7_9HEMI